MQICDVESGTRKICLLSFVYRQSKDNCNEDMSGGVGVGGILAVAIAYFENAHI